ncbi:MAG: hypothetical protein DRP83_04335 [Planctomycetota bacterium]|nr:MAG: hypothetical protein DRP83_04335 [Planctomycetota bacterium]
MTVTLSPKVEVWVDEVEGEKGRKRYRFRCEQEPVIIPEPEKKNGPIEWLPGKPKPRTLVTMLFTTIVLGTWIAQLVYRAT